MRNSIRARLTMLFIALAVGPLVVVGVVLSWLNFATQEQHAFDLQLKMTQLVAAEMNAFIEKIEDLMQLAGQALGEKSLSQLGTESILSQLLLKSDSFDEVILLNQQGHALVHLSRLHLPPGDTEDWSERDEFIIPKMSGLAYFSSVQFNKVTGEPLIIISLPTFELQSGRVEGVLLSMVRFKKIWDLLAGIKVSPGQNLYIVDPEGKVVAHRNPSVVLRGTRADTSEQNGIYQGLNGSAVVRAVVLVSLGQREFRIVAEQDLWEALALAINTVYIITGLSVAMLLFSVILGILFVRQIVQPIEVMAVAVRAISAGDLSQKVPVDRHDELGVFGEAFNDMTARVRKVIHDLECEIEERKRAEEERAKLEEQLRQAQKLESIGRLAGGIAHDLNNLLLPIMGFAELAQTKISAGDDIYNDLERIIKTGERASSLTRQLLAFSRRQVLDVQVFDLNKVIVGFQEMLRRLISENIELHLNLASVPCLIKADLTQIEQILLNLSINARDAMPDGGKFVIETDNVFLDETYAKTHVDTKPGHYVMLCLSDTGSGMDSEIQKHIFEPFFTSKQKGKGTGLGLATVFGIVKQHHGNIWAYSEQGKGTTFKIYLPCTIQETPKIKAAPVPERKSDYGTETVLVVEDESMVRRLICETLEAHGYFVIEAENPAEAIRLQSNHKGVIHLLLSDVIMPGMNGSELHDKLAAGRPDIKVLYISGYTGNAIIHHGVLDKGVNFMQKPFSIRELIIKVRSVLDT
jgi:signal transduction histidine kinase